MKLKQAILIIMDRDTLKAVVDDLEIEDVDRRSVEDMRVKLSLSRRAEPEMLLSHLNEKQVKTVCEQTSLSPKGRRWELVDQLLEQRKETKCIPGKKMPIRTGKPAQQKLRNDQKESISMSERKENGNQNHQQPIPLRLPVPPPGMMRVTRTELVWPGKYNEDGTLKEMPRVSLPFQVIETVNETRATREAKKGGIQQGLFNVYEGKEGDSFEEGWKNKLIWGDNLLVMGSLLEKFAGKIDLIYIDPPFATGADFSFTTEIGDKGVELQKEQSAIEEKAYRDTWGKGIDSYLLMMSARLALIRDLLSEKGSLYVHCDWRMNSHLRLLLDDLFGREMFVNEVVWHYRRWSNVASTYQKMHDNILFFSKTEKKVFNMLYQDYAHPEWIEDTVRGFVDGKLVRLRDEMGEYIKRTKENKGVPMHDVWEDINFIGPTAGERINYPTQKPEALIDRILNASSNEGDLIADFFCGSGTTLAVAEKLGRRWIGCDLGRWAIHVTRKRLLGIENCKPFEVLNLGRYERQYWQGVTFGEKKTKHLTEQAFYEYLAFILKLYGAQPVAGLVHLHGKKGRAMIHIGAVDAPVTIAEIDAAVDECVQLKQPELHVLGWEWEMGLYDLMVEAAKKKGVKLVLLQIPREVMEQQAAAKGDVRFFELAYLEAEIQRPSSRSSLRGKESHLAVQVALKDFVIPNTELIPEEVRAKVKKWSDYIDYWAVDWDFQNDTFMQGWVAFRTRKERKLPLVSDPHTYIKPGEYRILVKVIDIFGNDTSQAFDVEVPLS